VLAAVYTGLRTGTSGPCGARTRWLAMDPSSRCATGSGVAGAGAGTGAAQPPTMEAAATIKPNLKQAFNNIRNPFLLNFTVKQPKKMGFNIPDEGIPHVFFNAKDTVFWKKNDKFLANMA